MRYQIIYMEKGHTRYKFVAHGASYGDDEARKVASQLLKRGCRVAKLPVPDECIKD